MQWYEIEKKSTELSSTKGTGVRNQTEMTAWPHKRPKY